MRLAGNIFILLLMVATGLTACALPDTVATMERSKEAEEKPAVAEQPAVEQTIPFEEMDANFLYLASQKALKDGNVELAIDMLEALTAKDPEAVEPRLQLTELLLQYGRLEQADRYVKELLDLPELAAEQSEQLHLLQARLRAGQGQPDAALASLEKFLEEHPENIHARELQVRILAGQKRIDDALDALNASIRVVDSAELRMLQAQLLLNMGQREAAKQSLQRMQELAPGNDTSILMLHSIAAMEGNREEAEKLLRDFLKDYPDADRVSDALGRLLTEQNRLAEAILLYRDRASRTSSNHTVLQTLGFLYMQHGDFEDAEKTFRKLIEMQPSDAGNVYLAASLEAQERDREARDIYEKIGNKSPLYPDAQLRLAGMDMRQNHIQRAERRLRDVLKEKPEMMEAYALLSSIHLNQKRYQQLLDESEPLLSREDLSPQLLFNRAIAFEQMGNYAQTEAMLKRILERHRNHSDSLNFLGYIYAVQGVNLDEAEDMIRRALKQKPDDGYYLDSLAWVFYKRGDYAKALEIQGKAIEQIPDDPVMHEHLGDMFWRSGDEEGARRAWRKAIDLKSENPGKLKKKISGGLDAAE